MMQVPISTLHLFTPLEQKLIELLKSLSPKDWSKPTVAKLWTVKDVAAHLLDGNMRVLASAQDYTGDPPGEINSYQDLVSYMFQSARGEKSVGACRAVSRWEACGNSQYPTSRPGGSL